MKIRNGFVSNSSTSSFLIGLPKNPGYCYYGTDDIHNFLFPGKKNDDVISFAGWSMPLHCVDYVIFKELRRQKPIKTKKEFIKTIYNSGFYGDVVFVDPIESNRICDEFTKTHGDNLLSGKYDNSKEYKAFLRVYQKELKEQNKRYMQESIKFAEEKWILFKKLNVFIVEYGDEEGIVGMIMGANNIWENMNCIKLPYFNIREN
jgi:hypothetical protein